MPLLAIGPAIAAAYLAHGSWFFIPAVVLAVTCFWSVGIVHNFQGEIEDVPPLAMHAAAITIPLGLVSLALALFVV